MFRWYRELLEIKHEARQRSAQLFKEQHLCESCETLKHQLEVANFEKKQLLDRLFPTVSEPELKPVEVTKPRYIPWNVRKQMLEAEDREKARLMREAPKPIPTEDLEKELDLAAAKRETKTEG